MKLGLIKRCVAGGLGAAIAINGVFMLLNGLAWHTAVSSRVQIGNYHAHAAADAGAAFIAAGLGLLIRTWRPRLWPVAIAGLGFIVFHAAVHLSGVSGGHTHDSIASLSLLAIPAALALWAALPAEAERHS